jgi:hypothetical protein
MLLFSEECTLNLSFRPFFSVLAMPLAPPRNERTIEKPALEQSSSHIEDCAVIFLTSVELGCASQTMRELRSAPVIAHNMAALVYEKDI